MTIIYRTAGAWGAGKGSNLTPAEVDGNFWDHEGRIGALEESAPEPNNISNILVTGTQMTIVLEDATEFGPFTLPQANFRPSVVDTLDAATDGTYAPVLADANGYLRYSGASACTVIIPANATVAFAVDTEITFSQAGAGAISFDAPTDVTLHPVPGYLHQTAQHGARVTWKKVAADEWECTGWLAEDATA